MCNLYTFMLPSRIYFLGKILLSRIFIFLRLQIYKPKWLPLLRKTHLDHVFYIYHTMEKKIHIMEKKQASFITSEKYITVSWGKPQSFDTAPCVAVLLPDFGSTGRLPGSDRFYQRGEPGLYHLFAGQDFDRCFACALAAHKAPMVMHIREQVQHLLSYLSAARRQQRS